MPKYLVFINTRGEHHSNKPGSAEQMACDVANSIDMQRRPKDYYVAYRADSPEATMAMLKEPAKCSVELDDARVAIWSQEMQAMSIRADNVDEQVELAYSAIVNTMTEFNDAIATSTHCQDIPKLLIKPVVHAFDHFEICASFYVSDRLAELFDYRAFDSDFYFD